MRPPKTLMVSAVLSLTLLRAYSADDCSHCSCTSYPVPKECERCCGADLLAKAAKIISQIMATPNQAIPTSILREANCVVVVPGQEAGAFIVGANYAQGVATCRTESGWSGPVFLRIAGGQWGFHVGGQGSDLLLVAPSHKGMQDLLESKFRIGEGASAAAGPVGRDAGASTDAKMQSDLLTWSRSRGLFAGIDLSGVSIIQNKDATDAFYGTQVSPDSVLLGHVPPPAAAQSFLRTVARYFSTRDGSIE